MSLAHCPECHKEISNLAEKCPHCGRYNTLIRAGHQLRAGVGQVQQWKCKGRGCGRTTTKPIEQYRNDKGRFINSAPTQSTVTVSNTPVNQS